MAINFDPREISAALREELTGIQHDTGANVLGRIVLSTPVGLPTSWLSPPPEGYKPGHARASWQVGVKTTATADNQEVDPGGAQTIANGIRKLRQSHFGESIVIESLAPYMPALNRGHSRQAGANFIEKATTEGVDSAPSDTRELPAASTVRPR